MTTGNKVVASMAQDVGKRLYQTYIGLVNPKIVRHWVEEHRWRALVLRREIFFEMDYMGDTGISTLGTIINTFIDHLGDYFADYEIRYYAPTVNLPEEFYDQRLFTEWSDKLSLRMSVKIYMR